MSWEVQNYINNKDREFKTKAEAVAFSKKIASEFVKAEKMLGKRHKVGYIKNVAWAANDGAKDAFATYVEVASVKKDGTPDKWKIYFDI